MALSVSNIQEVSYILSKNSVFSCVSGPHRMYRLCPEKLHPELPSLCQVGGYLEITLPEISNKYFCHSGGKIANFLPHSRLH